MINSPFIRSIHLKRETIPSFKNYPFNLPSLKTLDELFFHPKVTFLIGENGMGKSTLLEAIAVALGFNPEGGSFNFNFSTFDSHSALSDYLKVIKGVERPRDGFFLRAESFYNVASNIEEMDRGAGAGELLNPLAAFLFMSNHMAKPSSLPFFIVLAAREFTF